MKHFITVAVLLLSVRCYSQTSVKSNPYSAANLNQYMWSFSKSKAASEKPLVDFEAMDNWRGMGHYLSVSDDGSYFAYTVNKMAYNDFAFGLFTVDSLVIQSTKKGQRTVFAGLQPGSFTADSKQYIFQNGETLSLLQLGTAQVRKIADVASYKISQNKWLAYQLKDQNSLNLQNLLTGKEKQFASIAGYNFSNNGEWLICQSKNKELALYSLATSADRKFSSADGYSLATNEKALLLKTTEDGKKAMQFVALPGGDVKTIWTGTEKTEVGKYCIDASGKQVVFSIVENGDVANASIWYYEAGMDKAILKVTPKLFGAQPGITINNLSFSDNGGYIQLSMRKAETPGTPNTDIAGLEVWNHKDLHLQSVQSKQLNQAVRFNSIVKIENGKLVFTECVDRKILQFEGDFVIVKKDYTDLLGDRFWEKENSTNNDSTWIVDLKDGNAHLLPTQSSLFWFSPSGNYLVYFDAYKSCHYFSFDLKTGVVRDISTNVPENQLGFKDRLSDTKPNRGNLAAWLENETDVLIYDDYDIWKLDLTGKQYAVNITNGFGLSNNTMLNLFTGGRNSFGEIPTIKPNEPLILKGYNSVSKQGGFYKKDGTKVGAPVELYLGNYYFEENPDWTDPNVMQNGGMPPMKAKTANYWIVQRQSTNDAPNYYETSDFKNFKRLTNFQPQKKFQWFTEELVSFKNLDGTVGQGILYKSENFDPNKKYPVIIPVYGTFSNNMYQFPSPSYVDEAMEPSKSPIWFLNNGYLVFTPDIHVVPLKYGPSTFNVVEGAVQYLKQLPYVDREKLGCSGHSWSSGLIAYVFTQSPSITATTISGCGSYNPIANSLSQIGMGLKGFEKERHWGSLWENKEEWLDQTAVLQADRAKGALLMLANKEASPSEPDQTFQFFTALRRLDKPVWWLKYDKGGHTLYDQKELKDYTIRYTQFFDHYLKNAPAPQWMTQGIPYKLKGIESRYELDPQGTCNSPNGEPCLICQAWNKQYKRTPEMFTKPIVEWELDKDIAEILRQAQDEKRKELDKEGEVMNKKILDILKNGYPEDEKNKMKSEVGSQK